MTDLEYTINNTLKKWESSDRKAIIKELKHGANYECFRCNNKWVSKKLELHCPKCNSRLTSIRLKTALKEPSGKITHIATYTQEEMLEEV